MLSEWRMTEDITVRDGGRHRSVCGVDVECERSA